MINIKGQERISQKLNELDLDTFPHALMLVGEQGSGKHLIVDIISEKFSLEKVFLDEINFDVLLELQLSPYPKLCVFENLTIKNQNQILKFLEEPSNMIFVVILTDNKSNYLDTILNRCQIWQLEIYSKSILRDFIQVDSTLTDQQKDLVIEISRTPGDVISLDSIKLQTLIDLSNKVLNKLSSASYGNVFNILNHVTKTEGKLDFDLFARLLHYEIHRRILNNENLYTEYELTNNLIKQLKSFSTIKEQLFEHYLIQLKEYYESRRT